MKISQNGRIELEKNDINIFKDFVKNPKDEAFKEKVKFFISYFIL